MHVPQIPAMNTSLVLTMPTSFASRVLLFFVVFALGCFCQGCAETWRRMTDPVYAAQLEKSEREESEMVYWNAQVISGSPARLDVSSYKKLVVAVKVKGNDVVDQESGVSIVESSFSNRLLSKNYIIAARADLDQMLKEMNLQHNSGLTSTDDMVKAGKMMNVEAIMIIDLVRYRQESSQESVPAAAGGTTYRTVKTTHVGLVARLIDIQKGSQVWTASYFKDHQGVCGENQQKALELSAGRVAEAFPAKADDPPHP